MNWQSVAESARKGVEQAAQLAQQKVVELATTEEHVCTNCDKRKMVLNAAKHVGLVKYDHCRICHNLFCNDCLTMTTIAIYKDMWHPANTAKQPSSGKGIACAICTSTLVKRAIDDFVSLMTSEFNDNVDTFINNYENRREWKRPEVQADTNTRKAYRAAKLADLVIDYTPLGPLTTVAIRYAFYGTHLLSYIVPEDVYVILTPLMEGLQAFGVRGPTGILKLYYLGCYHERERKMNPALEYANRRAEDQGIISETCSTELLDHIGAYAGIAQWMYNCQLPAPHSANDWSSWYLSKLIGQVGDGWTLLACINETSKLPDGKHCPSFCLAARNAPSREAVLVIRGSKSAGCWAINAKYQCSNFIYARNGKSNVTGKVHTGMLEASVSILQTYQMERHLYLLAKSGYSIKIVGHSMGAGTATLMAAELHSRFLHWIATEQLASMPPLQAISYAPPPCVSAELADAFTEDGLVIAVINQDDFVPRLGRHTLLKLAEELKNIEVESNEWTASDKKNMQAYATTFGQAGVTTSSVLGGGSGEKDSQSKEQLEEEMKAATEASAAADEGKEDADWTNDVLVVGGLIVDLYKRNGRHASCVMSHRHPSLRSLHLLVSKGAAEHRMDSYAAALRGTKTAMRFANPTREVSASLLLPSLALTLL